MSTVDVDGHGQDRDRFVTELRAGQLRCHYCPEVATTMDHIVPAAYGGLKCLRNLQPACQPCNQAKGVRLPVCPCGKCQGALLWWRENHLTRLARALLTHLTPSEAASLAAGLRAAA